MSEGRGVCVTNQMFSIAQMGVGEGKSIGQWYGPNTVAQVLKYVPSPVLPILWGTCVCGLGWQTH